MSEGVAMSTNLTISCELIYLMGWLLQHEKKSVQELIANAMNSGLACELESIDPSDYEKVNEHLYTTILDFLMYMEDTLLEKIEEQDTQLLSSEELGTHSEKTERNGQHLLNLLSNIREGRTEETKISGEELFDQLEESSQQGTDVRRELFKKLLNNWSPTNKEPVN